MWVRLTLPLHQDQPGSTYSVMAQVARGTAGEVLIATVVHIQLKHVSGRHLTAAEFVVVSKGVEVARDDHPDKDGDGDTKDTPICIFVREQWATEQEAKQARFVAPACVRPQWPRTSAVARPPCSHLSPHGHLPPPQPELQPQRHYNIGMEVGDVYSGIAHRRMLRFPGGPLGGLPSRDLGHVTGRQVYRVDLRHLHPTLLLKDHLRRRTRHDGSDGAQQPGNPQLGNRWEVDRGFHGLGEFDDHRCAHDRSWMDGHRGWTSTTLLSRDSLGGVCRRRVGQRRTSLGWTQPTPPSRSPSALALGPR